MTEQPLGHAVSPLLAWLTRGREEVDLEVACAEHPDPARGVERNTVAVLPFCLADAPDHLFLEMLTCGAAHLYPRVDGCGRAGESRALVDRLAALVDALGHPGRLRAMVAPAKGRKRAVLDATHVPVSRRQVLLLSGSTARREMPAEYREPHERLVDAVRVLSPAPTPAPGGTDALPGPGLVLAAPACTACGVCVRACPTDALSLADLGPAAEDRAGGVGGAGAGAAGGTGAPGSDVEAGGAGTAESTPGDAPPGAGHAPAGRYPSIAARGTAARVDEPRHVIQLRQRPARCNGCRACLTACPVNTLQATGAWTMSALWFDDPLRVIDVLTRRCTRCAARIPVAPGPQAASGEVLCAACSYRRENPFGVSLPPEARERLSPDVLRKLGLEPPAGEGPAAGHPSGTDPAPTGAAGPGDPGDPGS